MLLTWLFLVIYTVYFLLLTRWLAGQLRKSNRSVPAILKWIWILTGVGTILFFLAEAIMMTID